MFITVLGLGIAAAVGAYIFVPYLLEWGRESEASFEVADVSHDALMADLADLEYDFRAGKLLEEDYRILRQEIELKLFASQDDRL